jgi:hypothetical protein
VRRHASSFREAQRLALLEPMCARAYTFVGRIDTWVHHGACSTGLGNISALPVGSQERQDAQTGWRGGCILVRLTGAIMNVLDGGFDLRYGPVDFCVPDHSNSCRCVTLAFVSPKSRTLNTCCAVGTGSV